VPLFNVFVDEKLAQRQQILNAQWDSLDTLQQNCKSVPASSWSEFQNNLRDWRSFFNSGSDWSSSSKTATDEWQLKAAEWAKRFDSFGCSGVRGEFIFDSGDRGIPGVKDPPPDDPGILDGVLSAYDKTSSALLAPLATAGWVAVGLVVVVIAAVVWIATKGKGSAGPVSVGGG